jgi:fido (protein-threonine AMPylation protein)
VIDSTKSIDDATPLLDTSGLKLSKSKSYTVQAIYTQEALNIATATLKYLSAEPTHKVAPFTYEWLLTLHEEVLGEVWEWAGDTLCTREVLESLRERGLVEWDEDFVKQWGLL